MPVAVKIAGAIAKSSWIRKMFEEELAKSGTSTKMDPNFYKRP